MGSSIEGFCQNNGWSSEVDLDNLSLTGSSPCFEDIVLRGVVQLAFLILLVVRAWQLSGVAPLPDPLATVGLIPSAIVSFAMVAQVVVSLLMLNGLIATDSFATYELVTEPLNMAAWIAMFGVYFFEWKRYRPRGRFIVPFLLLFAVAAEGVRMRSQIVLSGLDGRSYFFALYLVAFCSQVLGVLVTYLFRESDLDLIRALRRRQEHVRALRERIRRGEQGVGTSAEQDELLRAHDQDEEYRSTGRLVTAEELLRDATGADGAPGGSLDDDGLVAASDYGIGRDDLLAAGIRVRGAKPGQESEPDNHPEMQASCLSAMVFSWVDALISLGIKRPLLQKDIEPLPRHNRSVPVYSRFAAHWTDLFKQDGQEASVLQAMRYAFGCQFGTAGLYLAFQNGAQFAPSILLRQLIDWVQDDDPEFGNGYAFALVAGMFVALMIMTISENKYFHEVTNAGLNTRAALTQAVYRKSLRMSHEARQSRSIGQISSLISSDAEKIAMAAQMAHNVWSAPVRLAVAMYLLYDGLGASVFAGFLALFIVLPLQLWVMNTVAVWTKQYLKHTDSRVKAVSEVVSGARVVKYYSWEQPMKEQIESHREEELGWIRWISWFRSFSLLLIRFNPILLALGSFGAFAATGGELTPAVAFYSLSLFQLAFWPLLLLPRTAAMLLETMVSINRIQDFLREEELDATTHGLPGTPVYRGGARATGKHAGKEAAADDDDDDDDDEDDDITGKEGSSSGAGKDNESVRGPIGSVAVRGGWFQWGDQPTLRKINFEVQPGELVAIVGPTGGGKSSLLAAVIGDMHCSRGEVYVSGSVAYAPQQAWIFQETVKNNIVFGMPFDQERYDSVVKACNLESDFEQFGAGDSTELASRGGTLSGGQKQRVALARSIYSDADVMILDDILSALDAKVSAKVFHECVRGHLSGKTRIVATNQLHFVPDCDKVLVVAGGEVVEFGKPNELMHQEGSAFGALMHEHLASEKQAEEEAKRRDARAATVGRSGPDEGGQEEEEKGTAAAEAGGGGAAASADDVQLQAGGGAAAPSGPAVVPASGGTSVSADAAGGALGTPEPKDGAASAAIVAEGSQVEGIEKDQKDKKKQERKKRAKLIQEEKRAVGGISFKVYWGYVEAAGGLCFFLTVAFSLLFGEAARVGSSFWLGVWSTDAVEGGTIQLYMGVYFALSFFNIVMEALISVMAANASVQASSVLHARLLWSILRAPMSFFDATPVGRLLNRFAKDVSTMDTALMFNVQLLMSSAVQLLGTVVIVGTATPYSLVAYVPLMTIFYFLQRWFRTSSRELKRLDAVSRSPVYNHFTETLDGMSIIRAHDAEERETVEAANKLDNNIKMVYMSNAANRWLSIRLEVIGGLMLVATAVFGIVSRDAIGPENVGLAVSYSLTITVSFNMCLRMLAEAENAFNSVERVLEMCDVKPEKPLEASDLPKPPKHWPTTGKIVMKDVVMSYRPDLPPVLNGLTVTIPAGKSVGLCGRTGAGKSSIMQALYRLIELKDGSIEFDGETIAQYGLRDVRQAISIIPQDPVLFAGTIKYNLDPFNRHDDTALWKALTKAQLAPLVESHPKKLQYPVAEGGNNLSVGQRQLLCLARALLKKSNILCLDEASANLDTETDTILQATLRREFKGITRLTIAHRLNTVIDSDLILVLDKGQVAEYGPPSELLQNPDGIFRSLVDETGPANAAFLERVARGEVSLQEELEDAAAEATRDGGGVAGEGANSAATAVRARRGSAMSHVGAGGAASSAGTGGIMSDESNRGKLQRLRASSHVSVATPALLAEVGSGGGGATAAEAMMAQARREGLRQGFDASVRFILDSLRTRHGQAWADELERAGVDRRAWLSHMYSLLDDVDKRRMLTMEEDGFDIQSGGFSGAASLSFDGGPLSLGIAGRGGGVYEGVVGATTPGGVDSGDDLDGLSPEDDVDL